MIRSRDPRIRQRINQISNDIQSANEFAQEGLYAFSQSYFFPCWTSLSSCIEPCTAPCVPSHNGKHRRRRRGYSEAEANFDFYDDWHNAEEEDSLLGWNTAGLDRLLAGSGRGRIAEQPRRQRKMNYGTRHIEHAPTVYPDNQSDRTIISASSFTRFLERFSWWPGASGVKYHPSAADLQEHPSNSGCVRYKGETQPPLVAIKDGGQISYNGNGRNSNGTWTESFHGTYRLLSPRNDLFTCDEGEEDAVPLGDEFAFAFARHVTGLKPDDQGSMSEMVRSTPRTLTFGGTSLEKSER